MGEKANFDYRMHPNARSEGRDSIRNDGIDEVDLDELFKKNVEGVGKTSPENEKVNKDESEEGDETKLS